MKQFVLEHDMLTVRGLFYPTGYIFLMFPSLQDALDAEKVLQEDGYTEDSVSLLDPQTVLAKVARTLSVAEMPISAAGAEAGTVRRFAELATQGHHALMIYAPLAEETEHIMNVLRHARISFGRKYRHLSIDELG